MAGSVEGVPPGLARRPSNPSPPFAAAPKAPVEATTGAILCPARVDAPKTGLAAPNAEGAPKVEVLPNSDEGLKVVPKAEGVAAAGVEEEEEPNADVDDEDPNVEVEPKADELEPKAPNAVDAGFPNAGAGDGDAGATTGAVAGEGEGAGEVENAPKPPEKGDAFFSSAGVLGVAAALKVEVDPNVEGAPNALLPNPPKAGLVVGVVEGEEEKAPNPLEVAGGLVGVPKADEDEVGAPNDEV